ncbi:hypothetical protein NKOR_05920 [Candidatus Nitrosopumilus koreensis AR1]|uniref:Uncharacterized protein n=1 Tax=Candidatus Nitrosopumilus koreensis AR1 TaxID=1229908 RepID=K0B7D2_9ARCH|nr:MULTISPECIES: hypothetical protein [Nitrosopumilus]AFS81067.1 hypothetical protein NKOR_05920 [Candidatus Nitrosopumilus koreensis AR1]
MNTAIVAILVKSNPKPINQFSEKIPIKLMTVIPETSKNPNIAKTIMFTLALFEMLEFISISKQ